MKHRLVLIVLVIGCVMVKGALWGASGLVLPEDSHEVNEDLVDEQEIKKIVEDTAAHYASAPASVKQKASAAGRSIFPAQLYTSLFLNDPFAQPLTTLPMLHRTARFTTEIEVTAEAAEKSFGSLNSREDLASRIFGKKDIQLQDFVLVTRLAAKGGILNNLEGGAPANLDDFTSLATEPVVFEAFNHREQIQLGASVTFFEKSLRLSGGLPVVVGTNQLRVGNDGGLYRKVLDRGRAALVGDFREATLAQFVDAATSSMGMKTGERISHYGLGQAFIGASYDIPVERLEYFKIGAQLYLPTAPAPEANRVWPVELAPRNMALGGSGALLYAANRFFNPYVQADARFNFASKNQRRVPRMVARDGAGNPGAKMALGSYVGFAGDFNNEQEASIRGFSDFSSDVKGRLGHTLNLQLGNIIERVAGKGGYLDVAYRLGVKAKDEVLEITPAGKYNPDVLTANTDELMHQVRLGYGYHFTNSFRLNLQASLVVAGKNTAQALSGTALFGFSF